MNHADLKKLGQCVNNYTKWWSDGDMFVTSKLDEESGLVKFEMHDRETNELVSDALVEPVGSFKGQQMVRVMANDSGPVVVEASGRALFAVMYA